jgi:hypothetical protein
MLGKRNDDQKHKVKGAATVGIESQKGAFSLSQMSAKRIDDEEDMKQGNKEMSAQVFGAVR